MHVCMWGRSNQWEPLIGILFLCNLPPADVHRFMGFCWKLGIYERRESGGVYYWVLYCEWKVIGAVEFLAQKE